MDKIVISEGLGWRWKRTTWNNALLVMSAHNYASFEACRAEAERINAEPYEVEIHSGRH